MNHLTRRGMNCIPRLAAAAPEHGRLRPESAGGSAQAHAPPVLQPSPRRARWHQRSRSACPDCSSCDAPLLPGRHSQRLMDRMCRVSCWGIGCDQLLLSCAILLVFIVRAIARGIAVYVCITYGAVCCPVTGLGVVRVTVYFVGWVHGRALAESALKYRYGSRNRYLALFTRPRSYRATGQGWG